MEIRAELIEFFVKEIDRANALCKSAWVSYSRSRDHATELIRALNAARTTEYSVQILFSQYAAQDISMESDCHDPSFEKALNETMRSLNKARDATLLLVKEVESAKLVENTNRILYEAAEQHARSTQHFYDKLLGLENDSK